ncbi:hypothetical protein M758_7G158400 [Ceratodon purpureus]|nr:hypothetical protein M758_7G158400 [Ceratodon purpureus]
MIPKTLSSLPSYRRSDDEYCTAALNSSENKVRLETEAVFLTTNQHQCLAPYRYAIPQSNSTQVDIRTKKSINKRVKLSSYPVIQINSLSPRNDKLHQSSPSSNHHIIPSSLQQNHPATDPATHASHSKRN